MKRHALLVIFSLVSFVSAPTWAQTITYPDPGLHSLYPAGGRQGQTVQVRLGLLETLHTVQEVLIDGPPGIAVSDIKPVGKEVQAIFTIAPEAVPGRRLVRVRGGASGLTNFRFFFVGTLPELLEKERNDTPSSAQEVATPTVINGRIAQDLDVDCFAFQAKSGQRLVAAVLAHGMDSTPSSPTSRAFVDASLELLDDQGRVLAAADDTLGLDPLIEYTVQTDGRYTLRVQSLGFKGGQGAVYRLTVGEVPYPIHVFPPGGQRGQQVQVEIGGPNVSPRVRQQVTVPAEGSLPLHFVATDAALTDGRDLPFHRGDFPERIENEPNNERRQAESLSWPSTINGRFDQSGDEDWYRLRLKKGQGVLLEVTAQRMLRSPVDTLLEVYDAAGKKLRENDDGVLFARPNHCAHDFSSADSWLPFTTPQDGEYFLRVTDQNGTSGPRAIYRLTVTDLKPDFILYQWPDAVPVWGPGSTASFVVEVYQWGGMKSDLELRVEGLPAGWTGSTAHLSASRYAAYQPPNGLKALLTITAPSAAAPGTVVPFRVFGKSTQGGGTIEHEAQYLTLYGNSHNDGMWLRHSPGAHAVVAGALDSWLETPVKEIAGKPGATVHIPVKVHRRAGAKAEIGVVLNGPTASPRCSLGQPLKVQPDQHEVMVPVTIDAKTLPGTHGVVVARSWGSDLRAGRPGPCTPIIKLHVLPPDGGK